MKKFLFCLFLLFYCGNLSAENISPVNLLTQDVYVAKGFLPGWINKVPDDKSFKKISRKESGITRLSVPELKIEGLPERMWFSLESHGPEFVTFLIPFQFSQGDRQNDIFGLFFGYIGGCWEIYLNGITVKSEFHLDEKGDIAYTTNSRNIFIPLNPDILRTGSNLLAIKVYGDPTFVKTGIYQNWPNIVAEIGTLYPLHSETMSLILISIYMFIGMYHLFLFGLRQSEKYNLYFGLLCLFLFVNQFTRTSAIYNIITDTGLINRIELVFLYTLLPLLALFVESILFGKIQKLTGILSSLFFVFIPVTIFSPMPFVYDLVLFWEKFIALPVLCYIVFIVMKDFARSLKENNTRFSSDNQGILMKSFKGLLLFNSGRLIIGLLIVVSCVILDIVMKRYYFMHINPARYGFLFLIIGTTLNLADNFVYIHRRAESLNISLNEKVSDLNDAYERISISEEKYRMLIEGVNHYICTTDLNGNLLTANKKLIIDQRLNTDMLGKINIMDLFYIPVDDKGVTRNFISEKLNETIADRKQVLFKANMKSSYRIEPKEMSIYFEFVNIEGAQEIMVKAYDTIEDSLLKNMVCEKQVLEIGNYLSVAEEISQRLVRNVERYYDPKKINILRIALREIILNSIEHGNLNISYSGKTDAIENGNYFEFISERQNDPRFRDKKILIEYALTPREVSYTIRDDGNGFDHISMRGNALIDANENLLAHGRGIAMTVNAFDEVLYNEKGNEVKLIKYFESPERAV